MNEQQSFWQDFIDSEQLTSEQSEQFKKYMKLLLEWNENINLTTIVKPQSIVSYHFKDSLTLGHFFPINSINTLADVGTGAGFPGIPLKIKYPQIKVVLIEVTWKKIEFLNHIIDKLGLKNIEVYGYDWRTFLRKFEEPVELFCSRAALDPLELERMFKPGCPFKNSLLVYWASKDYKISEKLESFLLKEESYSVGSKKRKLFFFKKSA